MRHKKTYHEFDETRYRLLQAFGTYRSMAEWARDVGKSRASIHAILKHYGIQGHWKEHVRIKKEGRFKGQLRAAVKCACVDCPVRFDPEKRNEWPKSPYMVSVKNN